MDMITISKRELIVNLIGICLGCFVVGMCFAMLVISY